MDDIPMSREELEVLMRRIAKMKEMIYLKNGRTEILYKGGVVSNDGKIVANILILNKGGVTPVAYVTHPDIVYDHDRGAVEFHDRSVMPHEGFTFFDVLSDDPLGRWWFGWDYNHANDYIPGENEEGKKWTTEEIVKEAKKVAYAFANKEYDIV